MPRRRGHPGGCTVCAHAERTRLELLLAGGAGQTSVARKFGLSKDAVHRHWHGHVSEERRLTLIMGPVQRQALAAQVAEENTSVLDNLRIVRSGLYRQYDAALEAGDRQTGALLAGKLHENLRITAKITGELASSPLVQSNNLTVVMGNPQVQTFLQDLASELRPFPEARQAVAAWLKAREAQTLEAASGTPALEHEVSNA